MTTKRPMPRLLVADLDGTLLHDAASFEERFLTGRCVAAIERAHDQGIKFAVSTARPVSTALPMINRLPVDACAYLNGALIDTKPSYSDEAMLIGPDTPDDGHLLRVGFPASRGCAVCRDLLDAMPGLRLGIVMHDVRYTNFDVRVLWQTQSYRLTDFTDVPDGMADKIIILPDASQRGQLAALIPSDFAVSISEGIMWMLSNPRANKGDALDTLCRRLGVSEHDTVSFGDDTIDIGMLSRSGYGVAVANAHPELKAIADGICPSNNDDGVARWIEALL